MKVRNTFIIFLVSGFWHGANWTFIVWGALNALYIMPLVIFNRNRNNLEIVAQGRILPGLRAILQMLVTFTLTTFAWIVFRSENISQAYHYIRGIFSRSLFKQPELMPIKEIVLISIFMIIEWMGREQPYAIARLGFRRPRVFRWAVYYVILFCIFYFAGTDQQFIYFQF